MRELDEQGLGSIFTALQQVQTEQTRIAAVIAAIQMDQQRTSVVMTGMQRDVGDIVTDQAALGAIIRGNGTGGQSLITRVALAEKTIEQAREELAEHRRVVEQQMEKNSGTLEAIRTSVESQQREQERVRTEFEKSRAQSYIQVISWSVSLLAMIVSAVLAITHH